MKFIKRSIHLASFIDEGFPTAEQFYVSNEELIINENEEKIDGGIDVPAEGIAVQILYMSADPYLRGNFKSTAGMYKVNDVIMGFVSGKVLFSNSANWKVGDLFGSRLAFSTHQILNLKDLQSTVIWKLSELIQEFELSLGIGLLGMPGATAWGGLVDVLQPKENEILFVSAAAGCVGNLVGSLAKAMFNITVIGSCGGEEKVSSIKKDGFDHTIDYKKCSNAQELIAAIKEKTSGIDMYFENVGGMHFEAAMSLLKPGGRVAVCGQISEYNSLKPQPCFFYPMQMIYTSQRIEGFLSTTWLSGKKGNGEWLRKIHELWRDKKITFHETVTEGIENWPQAFISLFTGGNVGKVVIKI